MNKKLMAVAVVAIIVIAGAAAAVYYAVDNKNNASYYSDNTDCRLEILGNADENDYLDSNDVDKINEMTAEGKYSQMADADNNGTVDAADAKMVQDIIDLKAANAGKDDADKECMSINYINADGNVVSANYPVFKIVVVNTQRALDVCNAIGVESRVVAINDYIEKYGIGSNPVMYDYYNGLPSVGDRKNPDLETLEGVNADTVYCGNSSTYLKNVDSTATTVGNKQILRLVTWEDGAFATGALMLGFFTDADTQAQNYVKWMDDIDAMTDQILDGISDKSATSFLAASSATYFGAQADGCSSALTVTGATNVGNNIVTDTKDTGDYVANHIEDIITQDPDYIIITATISKSLTDEQVQEKYDGYLSNSKNTGYEQTIPTVTAVKEGNIAMIDYYLPFCMMTLLGAKVMFADEFASVDVDSLLQEYITNYCVIKDDYTFNANNFYYIPSDE
ncbi:MAG: ABC transporter substrate-binding protein [Candidatus Methanomethylophilus sp.]|nr:ABC transporter substrate-binding protein [Methanomethylophilus sp.]